MGKISILLDVVIEILIQNLHLHSCIRFYISRKFNQTCIRTLIFAKLWSIWLPVGKFLQRRDSNMVSCLIWHSLYHPFHQLCKTWIHSYFIINDNNDFEKMCSCGVWVITGISRIKNKKEKLTNGCMTYHLSSLYYIGSSNY